ncbi:transmembrane protein 54a [Ictalurus punctatus]|uniref:Transmembrane protein 54a n=1 Tax=Ictalurus punctatus TaxID=7998 RepID=A0A2D0RNN2_ICTPU|nr:transmembrane protein 54a [Ictalurus punctatus]
MGVCCRSLKDAKVLMKMGLGLVLVGHLNFLLGALVHGTVLRNVNVNLHTTTIEYAIANVIALAAGLVAVIGGISAITLSKNMKNQPLKWSLLVVSLVTCFLGTASVVSVLVAVLTAINFDGLNLLSQCMLNSTFNTYSITNECPFDPTRIYGTTLTLWILLIIMSVVEVVFSARCFAACTAFLRLPCPWRTRPKKSRVRFRAPKNSPPSSPVRSQGEEFPAEQHDLLSIASPTEENSWM